MFLAFPSSIWPPAQHASQMSATRQRSPPSMRLVYWKEYCSSLISRQFFYRSSAIYFSNHTVVDERVACYVVAPTKRFTFLTQSLRALYERPLALRCRMEMSHRRIKMELRIAKSRYGF